MWRCIMDLSQLSQFGMASIFIAATWKLYQDMRVDSTKREERLMEHLDKVANTLSDINERLCTVERCVSKEDDKA